MNASEEASSKLLDFEVERQPTTSPQTYRAESSLKEIDNHTTTDDTHVTLHRYSSSHSPYIALRPILDRPPPALARLFPSKIDIREV